MFSKNNDTYFPSTLYFNSGKIGLTGSTQFSRMFPLRKQKGDVNWLLNLVKLGYIRPRKVVEDNAHETRTHISVCPGLDSNPQPLEARLAS